MEEEQFTPEVTATLISSEDRRMAMLPSLFGRYFTQGEALVYHVLRQLSEDYDGGFWHYFNLSNGGHYMAPDLGDVKLSIRVAGNGFEGEVSPDAAGIIALLFALDQLIHQVSDEKDCENLIHKYHLLQDFVLCHPERACIRQAID